MVPMMRRAFAITPSDTVNFTQPCNMIYVGVTGDVKILLSGDSAAVVFKAAPVGLLPFFGSIKRVDNTGTTATNLVGLGVN